MRIEVALTVFFGVFCTLAQAKPQSTQAVSDCQVSAFVTVVDDILEDTFELVDAVGIAAELAVVSGFECAKDYDDAKAMVSCVGTTVVDFVNVLLSSVQEYIVNTITVAEALADDIYDCL